MRETPSPMVGYLTHVPTKPDVPHLSQATRLPDQHNLDLVANACGDVKQVQRQQDLLSGC